MRNLAARDEATDIPTKGDVDAKAPLASPTFSGTPTTPTAPARTDTMQIASTAFVLGQRGPHPRWTTGRYYISQGQHETFAHGTGVMTFVPLWVPRGSSIDRIACSVTTAAASASVRLGVYADDGGGMPGSCLLDAGTMSAATTGDKEITVSLNVGDATLIWLACVSQAASATLRTLSRGPMLPLSFPSLSTAFDANPACGYIQTGVTGNLPSSATVTGVVNRPYQVAVRAA